MKTTAKEQLGIKSYEFIRFFDDLTIDEQEELLDKDSKIHYYMINKCHGSFYITNTNGHAKIIFTYTTFNSKVKELIEHWLNSDASFEVLDDDKNEWEEFKKFHNAILFSHGNKKYSLFNFF